MTRRVVRNKLLQHLSNSKENVTSAGELDTRLLIVDQVEPVAQDTTITMVMCMREMAVEQIEMPITSIYAKRTAVFIVK